MTSQPHPSAPNGDVTDMSDSPADPESAPEYEGPDERVVVVTPEAWR